jgi:hypothetical protein
MNQNTVITFSNRLQLYSTALIGTLQLGTVLYSSSCMYTNNTGSGVILLIKSDHLW